MPRAALAVIGANYGDEAKGAWVDRFVDRLGPDTLVVRANSGAQAGHTVVMPDGRRHVFSHVGSGAFHGAPTFLSRFFVAAPELFLRELEQLEGLGLRPRVAIDERALLTTPYDVIINHAVEMTRGNGRHGSCGVGFGEAIERAEKGFELTVADIQRPDDLARRLSDIRTSWVSDRLAALGVSAIPDATRRVLENDDVIPIFLERARAFAQRVEIGSDEILRRASAVVFENAQGLALDQTFGDFPHVTRSNTGLANIVALAQETGVEAVEATYATRAYLSRHGAGPLPHEGSLPGFTIVDPTNQPNAWQGALRFAPLDLDALADRLRRDQMSVSESGLTITTQLAVSCLDQAPARVPVVVDGVFQSLARDDLPERIARQVGATKILRAQGPGRCEGNV